LFTVRVKEGTLVALADTGWKLVSTPLGMAWHGAGNVDCVRVWFLAKKVNVRVSPTEALTNGGV